MLATKVRIHISSGWVSLNKHIKEATVRRNVVVQLIRMHQQIGHEDYRHLNMDAVQERARLLADTDEAAPATTALERLATHQRAAVPARATSL